MKTKKNVVSRVFMACNADGLTADVYASIVLLSYGYYSRRCDTRDVGVRHFRYRFYRKSTSARASFVIRFNVYEYDILRCKPPPHTHTPSTRLKLYCVQTLHLVLCYYSDVL